MASYLTDHTQRVKLEDFLSEEIQCHSGVPQGSHLGPLLFITDINEVFESFENVRALGFADDLKLIMKIRSPQDCQLFQNDLDRLSAWCHNNKFNLNVAKCKYISFCRNTHPINYAYSINGNILDKVDEFKDLGVIVDQKMTKMTQFFAYFWTNHFLSVVF
jgi:Reverse transcriptase (RNA-dependent DNA polymerase)